MIYLNRERLNFTLFPNGETKMNEDQIARNLQAICSAEIHFRYESDVDLIHLLFLKKYLDRTYSRDFSLHILYMPYSRMDRSEHGSAFTLKYVAQFINELHFDHVVVYEPHSDVTLALLDRVAARYPTIENLDTILKCIDFDPDQDFVFFPDAGAQKRYTKSYSGPSLVGYKQRDFKTGQLGNLELVGITDREPRKVLIVDDLCSRGGTFMLAGEALRKAGADEVYLFITHCETNILNGDIFKTDVINHVYCFDTMINHALDPKMTVFQL